MKTVKTMGMVKEMRMARMVGHIIMTVLLVSIIAFCVTKTVYSQSRVSERQWENYCRMQEKEMVQDVRAYLSENGFTNSGVMLTRMVDADGSCEYTLTVHHDKIDRMDDNDRELLGKKLSAFDFVAENCTFFHEFLLTD